MVHSQPLTTDEFIAKAREKHGDKFSYEQTVYINARTKLVVICPMHGEIQVTPRYHLKVHGCRQCSLDAMARLQREKASNTALFVTAAQKKHKGFYTYLYSHYVNNHTKIIVTCPLHGNFTTIPRNHLQGQGCPECGRERSVASRRLTNSEFIEKSKAIHGNKYDYSITEYKNQKSKVWITCPIHGNFETSPSNHLIGSPCPDCGKVNRLARSDKQRMAKNEFVSRANKVHGGKYDYSAAEYKGALKKLTINCPEHGAFDATPRHHLDGTGCPTCANIERGAKKRLTSEEFISNSRSSHGDKYDYTKTFYQTAHETVTIICPKHGSFTQKADHHQRGAGCPACNHSRGETAISLWLEKRDIAFIHQWINHDCIVKERKAKFDFYLPSLNLIIEYDGEQHFAPIRYSKKTSEQEAIEQLNYRKKADQAKTNWAKENGIELLRIRFDEGIEEALSNAILRIDITKASCR